MKKTLITSATAFAIVLNAGMSMAGPISGHAAFGGGALTRSDLGAHITSIQAFDDELPFAGLNGAGQSAVKGDPQAAVSKEFEPGLVGQCSELPPIGSHHHKYSPCGG